MRSATIAEPPLTASAPVRALALYEAAKGLLVIVAGAGILRSPHTLETAAEALVAHLHLNPAKDHPLIFTLVDAGSPSHLWWLALGAAVYAAARFSESVGLWLGKRWAMWLAVLTAAIYIPFEIGALLRRPTVLAVGALAVNTAVVLYLLRRHLAAPHTGH